MAPKQHTTVPDQFEVYNELVRRSRRSALFSGALVMTTLLAMGLAFLSFTRPLPVVVTSDNPLEPRRIVAAGDTSVREIDAKRFFGTTAKKLHGWSSANVVSDLTDASFLMTARWRKRFIAEVNAEVKVPSLSGLDVGGTTTVLQTYVLAKIRNELDVDWDTATCAREGAVADRDRHTDGAKRAASSAVGGDAANASAFGGSSGVWHCRASAVMRIQPLAGDPVSDPKLTKRLSIRASFAEVAVTANTVDGLLVDFWDAQIDETVTQTATRGDGKKEKT